MERHREFRWIRVGLAWIMGLAGIVGCGQIVGIEEPRDTRPSGGAGGTAEMGGNGGNGSGNSTSGFAGMGGAGNSASGAGGSEVGGAGATGGIGQGGGTGPCTVSCNDGAWFKQGTGPGTAQAESVAFDADGNLFVAGTFNDILALGGQTVSTMPNIDTDGFVAKFRWNGSVEWLQRIGDGNNDTVNLRVAAANDGGVGVAGFSGKITTPPGMPSELNGSWDLFVAKLSAAGVLEWGKMVGGMGGENVGGVAIDSEGNIILTGYFWESFTCGGVPLTDEENYGVFVCKWDSSGKLQWTRHFGGPANQDASAIAVDTNGNIAIVGTFTGPFTKGVTLDHIGNNDAFVIHLDKNGAALKSSAWGTAAGNENAFAVATDGAHIHVGGWASNGAVYQVFVQQLDASLNIKSTKTFGQDKYQAVHSVALASDGTVLVTGTFEAPLDLGCGPIPIGQQRSIFVGALSPDLNCIWSKHYDTATHANRKVAVSARGTCDVAIVGSIPVPAQLGCEMSVKPDNEDAFVSKLPFP